MPDVIRAALRGFVMAVVFTATTFLPFGKVSAAVLVRAPNNLGLLGYWTFNEGKGTVATDFSGNRMTGTLTSMESGDWVTGALSSALAFDGVDEFVSLGTASALNPSGSLTVSAWMRVDGGSGTYRDVVSRWDSVGGVDERTYIIGVNSSNALYFAISSDGTDPGATIITDPSQVTTGTWIHVLGSWDGTTMRLYRDGVEVANSLKASIKSSPNTRTAIGATVGRVGDSVVSAFNGAIDEVRIYSRGLTASEVLALYNQKKALFQRITYSDGLVFYASLDESGGIVAHSYGMGGGRGALRNFALSGSTSNWITGKYNGGLNFDGTNDIVVFPSQSSLYLRSNLSLFAWVKTSSAYQSIISRGSAGTGGVANGQYGIGTFGSLCGGAGRMAMYLGGSWRCSASAINDGTWHHVGYTFDASGNLQYYIDGATSGSVIATATQFSAGSSNPLVFGADDDTANYNFPFNGSLDEVRIYNRVLTATEVASLYASTGQTQRRLSSSSVGAPGSGNLVAWHTFDGPYLNTTTSTDRSSQGNNGALTNGPVPTVGKVGQALKFDGSDDSVISKQNPSGLGYGSGDFSWFAWIYPERINDSYEMIWAQGSSGIPYLAVRDDVLHFYLSQTYETTSGYIAANTWQHVGIVRSSGTLTLYKNGVAYGTTASQGASVVAPDYAYISSYGSGGAHAFKGKIDDLRIYNKALSTDEILALYNQGK